MPLSTLTHTHTYVFCSCFLPFVFLYPLLCVCFISMLFVCFFPIFYINKCFHRLFNILCFNLYFLCCLSCVLRWSYIQYDLQCTMVLFRSARTSFRAFDFCPVPSATIFPEHIDELKHCRQALGAPQTIYFLKADDVSHPNSDENANTKTNTKAETNKGS